MWSCGKEKLSIPLEAHHKTQSSQAKKLKELLFFIFWAIMLKLQILSFPDRELSNKVRLVQVRPRKVVVHTFLGLARARLMRPS